MMGKAVPFLLLLVFAGAVPERKVVLENGTEKPTPDSEAVIVKYPVLRV